METKLESQIHFLFYGPFDGFISSTIDDIEVFSGSPENVRDNIGTSVIRAVTGAISYSKGETVESNEKLDQNGYNIVISLINHYKQHLNNQKNIALYFKQDANKYDEILEALYEFRKIVINYLAP